MLSKTLKHVLVSVLFFKEHLQDEEDDWKYVRAMKSEVKLA